MQPMIRDGQLLLVNQWAYIFRGPRLGEIVVFQNPQNKEQFFCKRITGLESDNYVLRGDNVSDSLDSRIMGLVPIGCIVGRVFA